MHSQHCQTRVTKSIEETGAELVNIQPGLAEVMISSEEDQHTVLAAIEKIGYPADVVA